MNAKLKATLLIAGGVYVIFVHAILIILVLKTDFLLLAGKTFGWIPPEEWTIPLLLRTLEQAEQDLDVPTGAVILLGDSIIARLNPRLITSDTVNFGIGGETTRTLYAHLSVLRSLTRSETVVIGVGVNDLKYRRPDQIAHDYGALLDRLARRPTVIVLAVLPIEEGGEAARSRSYLRNEPIGVLNRLLGRECKKHANCRVLDAWPVLTAAHGSTPRADLYDSDEWHLSEEGSNLLAAAIRRSLQPP
jgi:lysophospholipase L1-like esterase